MRLGLDDVRGRAAHGPLWLLASVTRSRAVLPQILVASPCDNEAHVLDGCDPLHGGAIGVELIGGRYLELHGVENLTYAMITTVEESLEMAGVIIFIWALLVTSC